MLMDDCWLADAEQRPTFSQLVHSIDIYLSSIAGYMDLSQLDRLPTISEAENISENEEEDDDVFVTTNI